MKRKRSPAGQEAEAKPERSGRRGIQSIEVGFRILDYLRTVLRPVPLKMIAAETGLSAARTCCSSWISKVRCSMEWLCA